MTEKELLHYAFLLAKKANPKEIRPNPFVGAIVVCENGKIIGEGYHQKAGEAHAEVFAINDALKKGADLSKSRLFVTLEPCSHQGKTPPCTSLILAHKIPHVIIGSLDPNPLVSGIEILEKSGVKVTQLILPEIQEMNNVFNINQQFKRPKYIIKSATTINGMIADRNGDSQWISNEKSRAHVHQSLRANVDAILSTAKTIMKDNSRLNIRLSNRISEELNTIVIDRDLDLLKEENKGLFILNKRTNSILYIITEKEEYPELPPYIQCIKIPFNNKELDFEALHKFLLSKNICQLLVEAGGKLNASLLASKSVDELFTFLCPSILTDHESKNAFEININQSIKSKFNLKLIETKQFDDDLLLQYKVLY